MLAVAGSKETSMRLEIRVIPNAKKFSVSLKDNMVKVHVNAKAEEGKANAELVERLSNWFESPVKILSGEKSRRKVIWIEGDEQKLIKKFKQGETDGKDIH
ncbi:YggU family protein [Candidatus Micrarchaeota archaeon]|nr:YggU family protein [Candidatus Micrarchaeota archaeon]